MKSCGKNLRWTGGIPIGSWIVATGVRYHEVTTTSSTVVLVWQETMCKYSDDDLQSASHEGTRPTVRTGT